MSTANHIFQCYWFSMSNKLNRNKKKFVRIILHMMRLINKIRPRDEKNRKKKYDEYNKWIELDTEMREKKYQKSKCWEIYMHMLSCEEFQRYICMFFCCDVFVLVLLSSINFRELWLCQWFWIRFNQIGFIESKTISNFSLSSIIMIALFFFSTVVVVVFGAKDGLKLEFKWPSSVIMCVTNVNAAPDIRPLSDKKKRKIKKSVKKSQIKKLKKGFLSQFMYIMRR